MESKNGSPPRRRSARLSTPEEKPAVRKTFILKKIVPRKTQTSEVNKENVERLSNVPEKRPKVSTPTPVEVPPPRPTILSPILPVRSVSPPPSAADKAQDAVWSQKVRRSYSRLSGDTSFGSPQQQQGSGSPGASRRETLFGFEKMATPKVMRSMTSKSLSLSLSASAPQASSSWCGVTLNLSEVEDGLNRSQEPDLNIPGVAISKKQSRRKRVQPIKTSELDDLAAKMNAEFDEAEGFELLVE
ncbi:sororin isoform X2 [Sardina pilchardus]|uniref:sororin isoform X2 n=1 Tax=Sardina pilchardus TaxID=27697 RepID=UPI002E1028C0